MSNAMHNTMLQYIINIKLGLQENMMTVLGAVLDGEMEVDNTTTLHFFFFKFSFKFHESTKDKFNQRKCYSSNFNTTLQN